VATPPLTSPTETSVRGAGTKRESLARRRKRLRRKARARARRREQYEAEFEQAAAKLRSYDLLSRLGRSIYRGAVRREIEVSL